MSKKSNNKPSSWIIAGSFSVAVCTLVPVAAFAQAPAPATGAGAVNPSVGGTSAGGMATARLGEHTTSVNPNVGGSNPDAGGTAPAPNLVVLRPPQVPTVRRSIRA